MLIFSEKANFMFYIAVYESYFSDSKMVPPQTSINLNPERVFLKGTVERDFLLEFVFPEFTLYGAQISRLK